MWRLRLTYLVLVPLVIWAAFFTRSGAPWMPAFIVAYGGDTLWAWMVFMIIRLATPRWAIWKSAALTLAISYAVETSQLYHAPWIDAIHGFHIGPVRIGLILFGDTFIWSDMACYTVGVLAGALAEWAMRMLFARPNTSPEPISARLRAQD
jgi:hypothetical protein